MCFNRRNNESFQEQESEGRRIFLILHHQQVETVMDGRYEETLRNTARHLFMAKMTLATLTPSTTAIINPRWEDFNLTVRDADIIHGRQKTTFAREYCRQLGVSLDTARAEANRICRDVQDNLPPT